MFGPNFSAEDFSTIVDMPPGNHQFKFIVDDEWKCSEDLPIGCDMEGNLVNCLEVGDEDGRSVRDGLEDISADTMFTSLERGTSISNPVEPPPSPITSYISLPPLPPPITVSPPDLPAHLQKVLLNTKIVSQLDPHLLPLPSHVSVNHLYACSIRDGVMAIGSTSRYRKKVCFGMSNDVSISRLCYSSPRDSILVRVSPIEWNIITCL